MFKRTALFALAATVALGLTTLTTKNAAAHHRGYHGGHRR